MEANKTTSSCNNVAAEPFNWDAYEQGEQGKQAKQQNKIQNLEDEIKFYNKRISTKKKDIARLERSLRVAERELKAAKEAERADKIIALCQANAEKSIIFCMSFCESCVALGKQVVLYRNKNNCWCIKRVEIGNEWEVLLECVESVFVEAEI